MTNTVIADLVDRELVSSGLFQARSASSPTQPPPTSGGPLQLSVAWGDLTRVPADEHTAGHYQGVLPVSAEKALDVAISGSRGLISEQTRRGWVVSVLGEVAYSPGSDEHGAVIRQAATAGMRRPAFSELRANQLYASLLQERRSLRGRSTESAVAAPPPALTPILAAEFLRVGVAYYIGTSWGLPDDLALQFFATFYRHDAVDV